MTILLLFAGTSSGAVPPLSFTEFASIIVPDEVSVGQEMTIYAEIMDESGPISLGIPPQYAVYGYTTAGIRTAVHTLANMTQVGSSDLWSGTWTPTKAGTYQILAVISHTGTHAATEPITVRPKFDPIGLAVDEVLVSRTGDDAVLGTA